MDITYLKDIAYGTHERQKLDILIPQTVVAPNGVLLFIHGGGWHKGDKKDSRNALETLAGLGYISATINYRFVSEDISVFDELDDITASLKVIKEKCKEFGFNVDKVIFSGASAGSQLALFYAYTRKQEAPITPVAACVYCPPVDFSKEDFLYSISGELEDWKYDLLSKCCGFKLTKETLLTTEAQEALKKISPIKYVSEDCIPTVVFHGKNDELIPFQHAENFVALLKENNIQNEFLVFENSGHELDKDPETWELSQFIIFKYLRKYLCTTD